MKMKIVQALSLIITSSPLIDFLTKPEINIEGQVSFVREIEKDKRKYQNLEKRLLKGIISLNEGWLSVLKHDSNSESIKYKYNIKDKNGETNFIFWTEQNGKDRIYDWNNNKLEIANSKTNVIETTYSNIDPYSNFFNELMILAQAEDVFGVSKTTLNPLDNQMLDFMKLEKSYHKVLDKLVIMFNDIWTRLLESEIKEDWGNELDINNDWDLWAKKQLPEINSSTDFKSYKKYWIEKGWANHDIFDDNFISVEEYKKILSTLATSKERKNQLKEWVMSFFQRVEFNEIYRTTFKEEKNHSTINIEYKHEVPLSRYYDINNDDYENFTIWFNHSNHDFYKKYKNNFSKKIINDITFSIEPFEIKPGWQILKPVFKRKQLKSKNKSNNFPSMKIDGKIQFKIKEKSFYDLNLKGNIGRWKGKITGNDISFIYNEVESYIEYLGGKFKYNNEKNALIFNEKEIPLSQIYIDNLTNLFKAGFSISNDGQLVLKGKKYSYNFKDQDILINNKWTKITDMSPQQVVKLIEGEINE